MARHRRGGKDAVFAIVVFVVPPVLVALAEIWLTW
jgi:hypothetical protein